METFVIILVVLGSLLVSAGVLFGEFVLTNKRNPFYALIPAGSAFLLSLLILVIMLASHAKVSAWLTTFYILQIPVVLGVAGLVFFRKKRRAGAIAEQQKQARLKTARRMEEEKHRRLVETLKGFYCAESKMKAEGQREIVILHNSGKTVSEIADISGADEREIELILRSFERYNSRINGETGNSDLILTPEQEEAIVTNIINSLPFDHSMAAQLWTKQSVRAMAAELTGESLSIRIISAYMKHWGFTVPSAQTIKSRSGNTEVRSWLAGEFDAIRKRAAAENGEILWIYTVPLDSVSGISAYMPRNPVMICAVSNDGSIAFKVYDGGNKRAFDDFVDALTTSFKTKIFAVINENFDEYSRSVGKEKLKFISDKIEIFKSV